MEGKQEKTEDSSGTEELNWDTAAVLELRASKNKVEGNQEKLGTLP